MRNWTLKLIFSGRTEEEDRQWGHSRRVIGCGCHILKYIFLIFIPWNIPKDFFFHPHFFLLKKSILANRSSRSSSSSGRKCTSTSGYFWTIWNLVSHSLSHFLFVLFVYRESWKRTIRIPKPELSFSSLHSCLKKA